jgi:hypothetical protein
VRVFEKADLDRSGTIDATELGRVLSTEYGSFSPRTVRRMLQLYADDKNNTTCIGTFDIPWTLEMPTLPLASELILMNPSQQHVEVSV